MMPMIPRPPPSRQARLFPCVAAAVSAGLVLAMAACGLNAATTGNAILAAFDGAAAGVNLAIVFLMGVRIGEHRAIAAGVPHVVFEFRAGGEGNLRIVDLPPQDEQRATRH
jgi:hypothetical protein